LGLLPFLSRSQRNFISFESAATPAVGDCCGWQRFFLYFSYTELGGIIPAVCLGIFLWGSITSRFYGPKSWFCWVGVAQAVVLLFIFKYWNFVAGLVWFRAPAQHYWAPAGAFPMEKRSAMLCT